MLDLLGIHASPLANEIAVVILGLVLGFEFVWVLFRDPDREWNQMVRKLNAEAIARRPTCDKCGGSGRLVDGLYLCGRCNGTGRMIPEEFR